MNFEEKLVFRATQVLMIGLPIVTLVSFKLGVDVRFSFFTGLCSLTIPIIYIKAKRNCCFKKIRSILTILLVILLNMAWYFLNGSQGPVITAFIVFIALFVFIWDNNFPVVLFGVVLLNVIFFMFFESTGFISLKEYTNIYARTFFNYFGAIIASVFIFVFAFTAKKNYIEQYNKAKKTDELKSAFLENISNEVKIPLDSILGYANLMAESNNPKNKNEYSQIIKYKGEHLKSLITDMVDISLLESDQLELYPERIHLHDIFNSITKKTENQLKFLNKTNLKIITEIKIEQPIVFTDQTRLKQIWWNLISNAIKYTQRGEIKIKLFEDDLTYTFLVNDTGLGIPKENFKDLFQRFHKIEHGNKKVFRGTGLGLYLCKKMSEKLGGQISFTSQHNVGSSFWFTIPKEKIQF